MTSSQFEVQHSLRIIHAIGRTQNLIMNQYRKLQNHKKELRPFQILLPCWVELRCFKNEWALWACWYRSRGLMFQWNARFQIIARFLILALTLIILFNRLLRLFVFVAYNLCLVMTSAIKAEKFTYIIKYCKREFDSWKGALIYSVEC